MESKIVGQLICDRGACFHMNTTFLIVIFYPTSSDFIEDLYTSFKSASQSPIITESWMNHCTHTLHTLPISLTQEASVLTT